MIEHLSPSTVQTYRECGKKVYFEKVLGVDNPMKYAMTSFGSSMHFAIEKLYKDKLSEKEFISTFANDWNNISQYVTEWKTDTATSLLQQGIDACKDFYHNVYGKYDVVEVEREFIINRGEGQLPILCYADAITSDGCIIDYKFGRGLSGIADSKTYKCNMATYAWAYQDVTGKLPTKIVFIKEKWKRTKDKDTGQYIFSHDGFVIDEHEITQSEIDFYKDVYDNTETGIQAGVWLPASDSSFFCKGCGYRLIGKCTKEV